MGLSFERLVFGHRQQHLEPQGLRKWVRRVVIFHAVCLAWIFFRAESVSGAMAMIGSLRHFTWSPDYAAAWLFLALLGGLGLVMDLKMESAGSEYVFQGESPVLRLGAVVTAMALLILFSASGTHAFIYFQF
jgi:alginate O-acetyltransferase complex protein AlgI